MNSINIQINCIRSPKCSKLYHFGHFYHDFLMPLYALYFKNNLLNKNINLFLGNNPKNNLGNFLSIANSIFKQTTFIYDLCKDDFTHVDLYGLNNIEPFNTDYKKYIIDTWRSREGTLSTKTSINIKRKVLIIGRAQPNKNSKLQDTGSFRRNILNINVLENTLKKKYDVKTVFFETMNFYDQQQSFYDVDIVIAQHGAGLSHLFDVKRNIKLVEIGPILCPIFQNLCNYLGFEYASYKTNGNTHIELNIPNFLKLIQHKSTPYNYHNFPKSMNNDTKNKNVQRLNIIKKINLQKQMRRNGTNFVPRIIKYDKQGVLANS